MREAPLALIAGVGHVQSAAARARAPGLDEALRERVAAGRPVAAICVGLQLLFGASDEGGEGLGLLARPGSAAARARVPHMGWNTLACRRPSALLDGLDGADVYFAHSYAGGRPTRTIARQVDHDGPLVAAVEARPLAGAQFHPERSGRAGARVLENLRAMVKKRVIPCLDVAGGRVVKGVNFANLREMGDPVELARRYSELGADELVFLDITATLEGRGPMLELIGRAADELTIPFTAAAASRARGRADAPARRSGQGRRQPGRVRRPGLLTALADEFGSQAVVCAIDARGARSSRTRAGAARPRRRRLGARGRRPRGGRDPPDLDRRGRDARGLRPRADAGGRRARSRCR